MHFPRKARLFWPVLATLVLTDCTTKELVVSELAGDPGPHPVVGEFVRLTLAYNPGAAMGISLGDSNRVVFSLAAIGALVLLATLYRQTAPGARLRSAAIALVAGGAVGNLLDRLRSPLGVVDFIDVGIGHARFWTFNVADMGVTIGALLLAVVLWQEDRRVGAG